MRLKTLVSLLLLGASTLASAKEKIIFWHAMGGNFQPTLNKIVEEYNKSQDKIEVEALYQGSYQEALNKFKSVQGTDKAPALIQLNEISTEYMYNSGAITPMQEFVKKDNYDLTKLEDTLINYYTINGTLYSMPFNSSASILLYNKDAFKEVGLDPEKAPTTWAELADYSVKLTNDHRKGVGIALNSGSAQWGFTGFALQNSTDGKNLMNEDGKKVYFNTPENVEALQFWLDLQNKYKSMASGIVQWTDLPTQFLAGEVAMIYHTTGNFANIRDNAKFNYGVAFLPGNKRVAAPTGGGNFYITPNLSPEKEAAAWKFIKFMTNPDNVAKWSIETGYVPTRESAYQTEQLKEYYTKYPEALVAYEQLPYAKPELTTYNAAQIWRILNDNIQSAVTGEATPQEALDNAQREATEVLNEYN